MKIKDENHYQTSLKLVEKLMLKNPEPNTKESKFLLLLATAIQKYEEKKNPTPKEALEKLDKLKIVGWRYGIMKHTIEGQSLRGQPRKQEYYSVHEVYIDKKDNAKLWTSGPVDLGGFEYPEEIINVINSLAKEIKRRRFKKVFNYK